MSCHGTHIRLFEIPAGAAIPKSTFSQEKVEDACGIFGGAHLILFSDHNYHQTLELTTLPLGEGLGLCTYDLIWRPYMLSVQRIFMML